jgi:hypothetical protein
MCEPRHLTTLWTSTACYRDSVTFTGAADTADVAFVDSTPAASEDEKTDWPYSSSPVKLVSLQKYVKSLISGQFFSLRITRAGIHVTLHWMADKAVLSHRLLS